LIAWARHLAAKALREKNYALAWKIQRDLVSDLQSLAYLPRSPEQYHVQIGTFLDLVQLAKTKVDATPRTPAKGYHRIALSRRSHIGSAASSATSMVERVLWAWTQFGGFLGSSYLMLAHLSNYQIRAVTRLKFFKFS
jgi:hypothetical protein